MNYRFAIAASATLTLALFFQLKPLKASVFNPVQPELKNCVSDCTSTDLKADAQNAPDPALIEALKEVWGTEESSDIVYSFTHFDLNDDGIPETIVSYTQGWQCSNRSCPIHIFKFKKGTYQLIGETWAQKGMRQLAVFNSKSRGWYNLATPLFNYDPRSILWGVAKFERNEYELTDEKIEPPIITDEGIAPPSQSRIVLDLENQPEFTLVRF